MHQRRRPSGAPHRHGRAQIFCRREARAWIRSPNGIDHLDRAGIRRRPVDLVGEIVGPLGSFVDPPLEDRDFALRERTGRRHLGSEVAADQSPIEAARLTAPRHDVVSDDAAERRAAAIQPVPVHLL
jgi:hypothetical protein